MTGDQKLLSAPIRYVTVRIRRATGVCRWRCARVTGDLRVRGPTGTCQDDWQSEEGHVTIVMVRPEMWSAASASGGSASRVPTRGRIGIPTGGRLGIPTGGR